MCRGPQALGEAPSARTVNGILDHFEPHQALASCLKVQPDDPTPWHELRHRSRPLNWSLDRIRNGSDAMTVVATITTRHCTAHASDSFITLETATGSEIVEDQAPKVIRVEKWRGALAY